MSGMRCAKYNSGDCTGTGVQWRLLAIVAAEDTDGAGAVSHHRLPPIVSCIGRGRTQPPPPPPATTTKLHRAAQDEGGFPWRLLSPPWQHHYATTAGCSHTNHPYTTPSPSLHLQGTVLGHSLLAPDSGIKQLKLCRLDLLQSRTHPKIRYFKTLLAIRLKILLQNPVPCKVRSGRGPAVSGV